MPRPHHPWAARATLAVVLALLLTALAPAQAQSPAFQAGDVWEGNYVCGRLRAATLRIDEATADGPGGALRLRGVFSFSGEGLPSGAYAISGRFVQGQVQVDPGPWINRPGQYVAVGFAGRLSGTDGARLDARVQGPGCTTLAMARVVRQPPVRLAAASAATPAPAQAAPQPADGAQWLREIFGLEIGGRLSPPRCSVGQLWAEQHFCAVPSDDPEDGLKSSEPLPTREGAFSMTLCGRHRPPLTEEDPQHPGCTVLVGETADGRIVGLEARLRARPALLERLDHSLGPRTERHVRSGERVSLIRRWALPGYRVVRVVCPLGHVVCSAFIDLQAPAGAEAALLPWVQAVQRAGGRTAAELVPTLPATVAWQAMTAYALGPAWASADANQRETLSRLFAEVLVAAQRAVLKELGAEAELRRRDYGFPAAAAQQSFLCEQLGLQACVPVRLTLGPVGRPLRGGEPAYELLEAGGGWTIIDFKVGDLSMLDTYRQQFAAETQRSGVNGLIEQLRRRVR